MKKKPAPPSTEATQGQDLAKRQLQYSEAQALAEKIRSELHQLRQSQAELASAMLQFLQSERESTRKVKETAALILTAIELYKTNQGLPGRQDPHKLIGDIAASVKLIYDA